MPCYFITAFGIKKEYENGKVSDSRLLYRYAARGLRCFRRNTGWEFNVHELKVVVRKVLGSCSADPPMKPGDYFTVSDGDIQIPGGGYVCLWALQSLMPLLTPKEREIAEKKDEDWMWRVHHAQCPDPNGRVIFKIVQTGKVARNSGETGTAPVLQEAISQLAQPDRKMGAVPPFNSNCPPLDTPTSSGLVKDLEIVVESVGGRCTSRMQPGDRFLLCCGRLYIPPGGYFCLYALQAAIPLLPAKQRILQDGDWLKEDCRVICPDPAGNVILRIDRKE